MVDSMLTISSTIRRTETQDGALLLEIGQGQMFSLNAVGSKILELVGSGCNEHEIATEVSALYGADIDVVREDVGEFLEALGRHGILQPREPNTGGKQGTRHGGSDQT
jgi:Coenzyme PQQ synthesis protein D (PqqD)